MQKDLIPPLLTGGFLLFFKRFDSKIPRQVVEQKNTDESLPTRRPQIISVVFV